MAGMQKPAIPGDWKITLVIAAVEEKLWSLFFPVASDFYHREHIFKPNYCNSYKKAR